VRDAESRAVAAIERLKELEALEEAERNPQPDETAERNAAFLATLRAAAEVTAAAEAATAEAAAAEAAAEAPAPAPAKGKKAK
jgi:hypothetical protein